MTTRSRVSSAAAGVEALGFDPIVIGDLVGARLEAGTPALGSTTLAHP